MRPADGLPYKFRLSREMLIKKISTDDFGNGQTCLFKEMLGEEGIILRLPLDMNFVIDQMSTTVSSCILWLRFRCWAIDLVLPEESTVRANPHDLPPPEG